MLSQIKSILLSKGYILYTRPYELNIVGIRSAETQANRFDDCIVVFYRTDTGQWQVRIFKATTDPGTYWLQNPSLPQGTAILAQGQYVNAYQIGMHKGKYLALVQCKPVTIIRDYNRDAILDFNNGIRITGMFGINIHRAMSTGTTQSVNDFSAGCQVIADAREYAEFMYLCEHHRQLYGNQFTYTLIDFRALKREAGRRLLLAGTAALALGLGLWAYFIEK